MKHYLSLMVLVTLITGACGVLPKDPNPDENSPYAEPAAVDRITPRSNEIGRDQSIGIGFTQYLDDDSFTSFGFLRLVSGGVQRFGYAEYSIVQKAVIWQPFEPLPRGIYLQPVLGDGVEDVLNRPLVGPKRLPAYRTSTDTTASQPAQGTGSKPAQWESIDRLLERECRGCHTESSNLNPLEYETIVGEKSGQVDRYLVKPYDASDSYLLQKLLWDYPLLEGSPQPPPWSDRGSELPTERLLQIEDWIDSGAKKEAENG